MEKKILDLVRQNLLFEKKKILVAVSGGVDSMALLHFFMSVKDRENLEIAALHFEHGIRGEESKRDADFVKNFCEKNDILCFMGAGDVPKYAVENKITLEMAARILRYEFFYEILHRENYDKIATAHHADDQAETVILNILRGSGVKGLGAMRPERDNIIRPFLRVSKAEILKYAKIHNITFREDSTNNSLEYRRNRIRSELLPILETYQSGIKNRLVNLAEIARAESDYLETIAKNKLHLLKGENLKEFKSEPLAIKRRIISAFLAENKLSTDFLHTEEIRKMLSRGIMGKRAEISKDVFAELSYSGLQIINNAKKNISPATLKIPGVNILKDFNVKITTKFIAKIPEKTLPSEYYADFDKIRDNIGVRTRLDGDFIKLAFGKKSLKKIFLEEKIDRGRRNIYPIIFSGTNILWLPKLRRSVLFKADKNTERILYMKAEEI